MGVTHPPTPQLLLVTCCLSPYRTEVYQVSGDWSRDIDETLDFNWASYRAETGTNPTVFTYM